MQLMWFTGPTFLSRLSNKSEPVQSFYLVKPELDVEIHPEVRSCSTQLQEKGLRIEHLKKFSSFDILVQPMAHLIHIARSYKSPNIMEKCKGWT